MTEDRGALAIDHNDQEDVAAAGWDVNVIKLATRASIDLLGELPFDGHARKLLACQVAARDSGDVVPDVANGISRIRDVHYGASEQEPNL